MTKLPKIAFPTSSSGDRQQLPEWDQPKFWFQIPVTDPRVSTETTVTRKNEWKNSREKKRTTEGDHVSKRNARTAVVASACLPVTMLTSQDAGADR